MITVLKVEQDHFEDLFASKRLLFPIVDRSLNVKTLLTEIKTELSSNLENSDAMADSVTAIFIVKLLRIAETISTENHPAEKHNPNRLYSEIAKMISEEYGNISFEEAKHILEIYDENDVLRCFANADIETIIKPVYNFKD